MLYQFPPMTLSHLCSSCCCCHFLSFSVPAPKLLSEEELGELPHFSAQTTRSFGVFGSCSSFVSSTVFTELVLQLLSSKDRNVFS